MIEQIDWSWLACLNVRVFLKKSLGIGDHLIRLKPNCITIIAKTHLITYKHISRAYFYKFCSLCTYLPFPCVPSNSLTSKKLNFCSRPTHEMITVASQSHLLAALNFLTREVVGQLEIPNKCTTPIKAASL